jgi:hypothetical protein
MELELLAKRRSVLAGDMLGSRKNPNILQHPKTGSRAFIRHRACQMLDWRGAGVRSISGMTGG